MSGRPSVRPVTRKFYTEAELHSIACETVRRIKIGRNIERSTARTVAVGAIMLKGEITYDETIDTLARLIHQAAVKGST